MACSGEKIRLEGAVRMLVGGRSEARRLRLAVPFFSPEHGIMYEAAENVQPYGRESSPAGPLEFSAQSSRPGE